MKNYYSGVLSNIALLFLTILLAGCVPPDGSVAVNSNAVGTNANVSANAANANANAAPTTAAKNNSGLPVTMPVLDAMFFDESFAAELKSKLQLTDEQIEKLKTTARAAVGGLDAGAEDAEYSGSTRAASKRAEEQIRETIGDEKANQLFELVRQRWSGGETETANGANSPSGGAQPNQIPTDTRIVVNAPAYRMDVFDNGKIVKSYKIGIGYPEFPLPTGSRKADTIIFNPTWTPPDEPWVKGKIKAGETVKAGDKLNPLGPIKIPIGLPSLIHGGKQAARLGNFASHGCVGLTNAQVQDFSLVLAQVSGAELTANDVKNYEKQKTETKNFKLGKTMTVELRYETIVVEDGKLKIFRDVYERGTNTEENLRRVLEAYGVSFDSLSEAERQKITAALKDMNRDAQGNPIDEASAANDGNTASNTNAANNANAAAMNRNSNAVSKNQNANATNKNADSNSQKPEVTRNVKGKKEVVIEMAQLRGKGYPAPMQMNSGTGK